LIVIESKYLVFILSSKIRQNYNFAEMYIKYTKAEEEFIKYWGENRLKKRKVFKQILLGIPSGAILVIAIFLNFFSGWFTRATMVANSDPSFFPVLVVAAIIIVAFAGIFTSYHKWDINENYYKELLSKKDKPLP